jgi:transcriptional regulator with PAS, ATPase and Fis domain
MSIHILTTDRSLIEQLTQLLAGGQQPFHFHNDLEALIAMLPKLKKADKVFYDLQLEPTLMAFDALRFGSKKTNLVAFERLPAGSKDSNCPKTAKHYFMLSPDLNKSGVRLKQLLHEVDTLSVKKKRARKKVGSPKSSTKAANLSQKSAPPITLSRYLTAKSDAMQQLLVKIAELAKQPKFVFLTGEDGADFELTAHELNFRTNGDQCPLHIVDPMRVEIDEIKRKIFSEHKTGYCYLGLSYEWGALTIARLTDYLEQLSVADAQEPSPCFILGHVDDSDGYLEDEVKALLYSFRKLGVVVEIPAMAERKDDVCLIAQSIFATLRTAHPFLMTRMLSHCAIEYLEAQCAKMSYSSLVRIIRNSMSLTERDTLTENELKSFGDDSQTTSHLIESLADEKYFKDQTGAA